jgi:hypothetical protein
LLQVFGAAFVGGGTSTSAALITANTTNFDGELSGSDSNLQAIADRLDDYDSLLDWATGKAYRVGNVVRVTTEGFIGEWRAVTAHTAAASFATDVESGYWEIVANSEGSRELVSQSAHGFVFGDEVYHTGSAYAKAQADTAAKAEVVGMVLGVTTNKFVLGKTGKATKTGWGLTAGAVYFLSASSAGAFTTTEPSVAGQISKPVGIAVSTTSMQILNMRGTTVGGTNLTTSIGLTLASSTVIQNVSNYPNGGGGKINGTITVLGPSPIQGCRVEINFQKISSTVYNISAAFPSSSIIAASGALVATVNETNGNISITLPTITGATSASVTFSIDASSVGTTLPLQIDSNLISWREPTMFRNRIINGGMAIDQRATATSTNGAYTVDRWTLMRTSDATESWARSTDVPSGSGFTHSLKNTISVADASIGSTQYSAIKQVIEGYNIASLAWGTPSAKPITISFWVKSTVAGNHTVTVYNAAADRRLPLNYVVNYANTWEYKTLTASGCVDGTWATDNTIGLQVVFALAWGTSFGGGADGVWTSSAFMYGTTPVNALGVTGSFAITGVQLEPGSIATPFEFRPYGTEFDLCKRYCRVFGNGVNAYARVGQGSATSTTAAECYIQTNMGRTVPTTGITLSGNWALFNGGLVSTTLSTIANRNDEFQVTLSAASTGLTANSAYTIVSNNDATAKIILSAEL